VRLAESVIDRWAPILVSVDLVGAHGGAFIVKLDGDTVFDRKAEGHHAEPGEVEARLERTLGPKLPWRES
jgi:predicted Rdx family selenoprotein